tara:strand:- start:466 stop:1530 length:1065 start_codon:yes stop_codon:yes gene_type:complete
MYHIILAGGHGSRFWPKSRINKPKQLLKIYSDESMIRITYNRLLKISNPEKILIIASKKITKLIKDEIKEIPKNNFIIEPSKKNTAPAIGLAALYLLNRDPEAIMAIHPSDHLIIEDSKFEKTIINAENNIKKNNSLLITGIKPTYPATGYGYIEYDNIPNNALQIYKVQKFHEKPPLEVAKKYLQNKNYIWNVGIFFWKASTILNEFNQYMPQLYNSLINIKNYIHKSNYSKSMINYWENIKSESIDYGVLEKTNNVFTLKADFTWSDLGSWYSLFKILTKDENNNYHKGEVLSINSKSNLIISPNKLTAVIGIDNLNIINLDDVTLIVSHDKCEEVKNIVEMLKTLNKKEYL